MSVSLFPYFINMIYVLEPNIYILVSLNVYFPDFKVAGDPKFMESFGNGIFH